MSDGFRRCKVEFFGRPAGVLSENENGYTFSYLKEYLDLKDAAPISVTLPLRTQAFESDRLFPFFDGLIPEGWTLDIAVKNWKLDPRDRMGLLMACCRSCIGAAAITPIEDERQ